jgi:hypothetical protein
MSHQNQHNRVAMTPNSINGATTMSQPPSPTQPDSISELELAVRLGLCLRAMLNRRKTGKLPPHFFARASRGYKQQVRYLLADVEAYEQTKQKAKSQK